MLSQYVQSVLPQLRDYFASTPIVKAWLFGSCSRGEEGPESDVDILVTFDENARISLMSLSHMRNALRKILNREVDLVEEGYLRPFAVPSANRDKVEIYARTITRP
ncbi:MAG: nucleotidyltransferase domain-containing protein [Bacteroidales bacterium]|nr:nucleotidyltransferase domain-containing protein [Bacteroidales bacterium]MCD8394835.1 nucleotidyltransferase domain-containing protein [Bacteroidales bacterium]